jgi:hypothetical protein
MRSVALAVVTLGLLGWVAGASAGGGGEPASQPTLDLSELLHRLVSLDHLPRPIDGKTAMASTWDRTGGNNDGLDFKRIEGDRNILLDVDGPGCVHRIFTGMLGKPVEGTQIRVFLDGRETPTFDMPVNKFFDDKNGPIPYPLVFHKTYPGTLFPIPFAKHCRVELYNAGQPKNWGNYWQVTYTRYAKGTPVKTLAWPLSDDEKKVLATVCQAWLRAESAPPDAPDAWAVHKQITLNRGDALHPGESADIALSDAGVIRQLRVTVSPPMPEVFDRVRLQCYWDGNASAAVDVPLGYFFGNLASGYRDRYYSLPLGVDKDYAYCRFPMPFCRGAVVRLKNDSFWPVTLTIDADVERLDAGSVPPGRFHATLARTDVEPGLANRERLPRFGPKKVPVHKVLELDETRGKYVGVFLHVDWPVANWWGEGDWLIWSDEDGWPPTYHGTGSEEYFNSGWCLFDRKAVSGIIREPTMRPGHIGVYSFHLNDAFPFEKKFRIVEEIMPGLRREDIPAATWRSTAYWYEFPPLK